MSTLKSSFRKSAIAVVVAAGLVTAVVAVAQPGSGYGPGMMMGGGGGMMMGGPGMMMGAGMGPMSATNPADMAKFHQERFDQLKSQLGITAEQQPAWDAFAATATQQMQTMQGMHQAMSTSTAPERMAMAQQFMTARQSTMGAMSESLGKLYEVLTPKQREVFDKMGPMRRNG